MPWKETCPMDEKVKFISAVKSDQYGMAALSRHFGISRKTGYKWLQRYDAEGVEGLKARVRAPHSHPNAVAPELEAVLLHIKVRHPHWGPRKIRDWLVLNRSQQTWPAASTIGDVYRRHGLVTPRKRRAYATPTSTPLRHCTEVNAVWSTDFKGQFRLGTGTWCYPLTITDNHSRYLLACRGLHAPTETGVWSWFERVFREYGLPGAIRTDNGSPFASTALGGLTRLSIWWIKLGIMPERIQPGRPDQNGRHERMHRTLKAEAIRPPKGNLSAQQRAFNRFVEEYNVQRPHESLNGNPPASVYQPSWRSYPVNLPEVDYASEYTVRRVRRNGEIKWRGTKIYISEALRGEPVGLLPLDDECWQVHFSHLELGVLDDRLGRIICPARR